jgi:hypothetical protein
MTHPVQMRPPPEGSRARKCPHPDAARALQNHPASKSASTRKGTAMGYSIFYIIGVVVVVALILAWLF